ncbi:MAG TPA: hypothetical protein DCF84_04435 [Bacteroidetes bacterium]|nr:hypothetical protein [Bacteroidota bacterium]
MQEKIGIHTDIACKEVSYIFHQVFTDWLGMGWSYTDSSGLDSGQYAFTISYAKEPNGQADLCLGRSDWSFNEAEWMNSPLIADAGLVGFKKVMQGALGFDMFSTLFFTLTRKEETFISEDWDRHGRFSYEHSLLESQNLLDRPFLEEYIHFLIAQLTKKGIEIIARQPRHVLTMDLDFAFQWYARPILLVWASLIKSPSLYPGWQTLRAIRKGQKQDPYDVMEMVHQWAEAQGIGLRIFIPVGRRSRMDRHVDPSNKTFTAWLQQWSEVVDFGLHPTYALGSWESPRRWEVLASEIEHFEDLTNQPCHHVRMHYLRCRPHEDYPKFSSLGIQNDWSMGYGDRPGFRAGISRPYRFFEEDKPFDKLLRIHPLPVMDSTFVHHMASNGLEDWRQRMGAYLSHAENLAYPLVFNLHNNLIADHNEFWTAFKKSLENV